MWRPRHWSTRCLIRQMRLLDVQTSELAKKWAMGKSRHYLTVEAVCNTLVDTLADTLADVEAPDTDRHFADILNKVKPKPVVETLRLQQAS